MLFATHYLLGILEEYMLAVKHFSKRHTGETKGGGGGEPGRTNSLSQQMPSTFAHLHKIVA